ncbi:MAG: helix-turn-helix domain-containing protein [Clostridiales Family XIII bacterium]|jgi:transcriptional regulator with XRE-family HTH domain|nr:helix-turn-helix domain-containing protein [Clostridiales Family XIII bacterium]
MDSAKLRNTFSARIRKLREERGLNQGQFADFVGVSRGAMSYYEQEARTPDIGVLYAISEKCGVSADYLIGLIPDRDRTVSDVCRETGLSPDAAKTLNLIVRLINTAFVSPEYVMEVFDEDWKNAMELTPFTTLPELLNLLLEDEEGRSLLILLGAIIMGAEFYGGSDTVQPRFLIKSAVKAIELAIPMENLTAALWVNIQSHADKLREKYQTDNPQAE